MASESYKEVLDATKHQDDKIGRFLTGIAFLTTGALAVYVAGLRPDFALLAARFELADNAKVPLIAWGAGAFLLLTLVSVAVLLLALSVPLRFPGDDVYDRGDEAQDRPWSLEGSLLFFQFIAGREPREWEDEWLPRSVDRGRVEKLRRQMLKSYVKETHNLSVRASTKYALTAQAANIFVLGLLFLAATLGLAIIAQVRTSQALGPIPFDSFVALLLTAILSGHFGLQVIVSRQQARGDSRSRWLRNVGFDKIMELRRALQGKAASEERARLERETDDDLKHWHEVVTARRRSSLFVAVWVAASAYIWCLLASAAHGLRWYWAAFAVSAAVVAGVLLAFRLRGAGYPRGATFGIASACLGVVAVLAMQQALSVAIVAASMVPVSLSVVALFRSRSAQRRLKHRDLKAMDLRLDRFDSLP